MKKTILICLITLILVSGCANVEEQKQEEKKELLIYCGITMIKPMTEIAKIIEEQENCKVIITKGGSGNLLKSIEVNKVGDLYLPGSDSYIKTCLEEGLVSQTVHVGYNKAAIMVQKGNPKNISANLDIFLNKSYRIYLGNPESGSIGSETKKIFEKKGIWNEVLDNTGALTTDSKDMHEALKNNEIDLAINWYATALWEENEPYIDALPIDEDYASKKKLVLGLLTTSKYPNIAGKFMDYAESEEGKKIFDKYGLYDIE